jgi:methyl-accepting chemotaxis protein
MSSQALAAIAAQVVEIEGVVSAIASSAREQAVGLEQVNSAINDMDRLTQQNAAMVEESTAATHELAREVDRLARLAERFRLAGIGDEGQVVQLATAARRPAA